MNLSIVVLKSKLRYLCSPLVRNFNVFKIFKTAAITNFVPKYYAPQLYCTVLFYFIYFVSLYLFRLFYFLFGFVILVIHLILINTQHFDVITSHITLHRCPLPVCHVCCFDRRY
jgi:hypothetical protein